MSKRRRLFSLSKLPPPFPKKSRFYPLSYLLPKRKNLFLKMNSPPLTLSHTSPDREEEGSVRRRGRGGDEISLWVLWEEMCRLVSCSKTPAVYVTL